MANIKSPMTSRKRVLTAMNREVPDRVPMDYSAIPGLHARVCQALGMPDDNMNALKRRLHVDFQVLDIPYVGPRLFPERPQRQVDPAWGIITRWVMNQSGGYWDYCDFPLADAGAEEMAAWPMPNPDHFDYAATLAQLETMGDYAVILGGTKYVDIINSAGKIRGTEQVLVDLISEDEGFLNYVDRRLAVQLEMFERVLAQAKGRVDVLFFGDDLGTQRAPLIGADLYRSVLKPRHKKFTDLGRAYGVKNMVHSCGSSSFAFADFIDIGVDIVDTLQPEAYNMAPEYLKKTYGDRLAFHGCVSTAGPLAYGTKDELVATVRETLRVMMPGGGFCLAPTHTIEENTPVENVLALYEAGLRYGTY